MLNCSDWSKVETSTDLAQPVKACVYNFHKSSVADTLEFIQLSLLEKKNYHKRKQEEEDSILIFKLFLKLFTSGEKYRKPQRKRVHCFSEDQIANQLVQFGSIKLRVG